MARKRNEYEQTEAGMPATVPPNKTTEVASGSADLPVRARIAVVRDPERRARLVAPEASRSLGRAPRRPHNVTGAGLEQLQDLGAQQQGGRGLARPPGR